MSPEGFAGARVATLAEATLASDHEHVVRLARYRFPGGYEETFVEVEERGPAYAGARLVSLSDAVHALLNLGAMELWLVGARATDWQGQPTGDGASGARR